MDFTATDHVREISVKELVKRFRDAERFIAYCRECPNYGHSWACPPFEFDADEYLSRWHTARIIATRIVPGETGLPAADAGRFISPQRLRLDRELLRMEAETGGRAFSFVGSCLYCPEGECTRPCGLPCRHPEKIRPSLEAFGFDITAILRDLFGITLQWPRNDRLPPALTLVTALLHN